MMSIFNRCRMLMMMMNIVHTFFLCMEWQIKNRMRLQSCSKYEAIDGLSSVICCKRIQSCEHHNGGRNAESLVWNKET